MLDELAVANLGIIPGATIEPGPGLVVVTGETGAGKTMLLGALQLLLGLPAGRDLVGPTGEEARIEGRFVDAAGTEVVVARRVVREGRSKAYLDGSMVPLRAIAERTAGLVEVVAQHDHLAIGTDGETRRLVDRLLDEEGAALAASYRAAWDELADLERSRRELGGDLAALERERELARFQSEEIAAAGLRPGDDVTLEGEAVRLRNARSIVEHLDAAFRAAHDTREALAEVVGELRKARALDPGLSALAGDAEGGAATVGELLADIRKGAGEVVEDPERLAEVEARLTAIGDLRRKYGATIEDIDEFGARAARRAAELDGLLTRADALDEDWKMALDRVTGLGAELAAARHDAGLRLTARALEHLRDLGFSAPALVVDVVAAEPHPSGADRVVLRFASDERLQPGPVRRVASGGELSRLVLALRLAGGVGEAPVIAFDEIDAGVGGRTALALGSKLADLARSRQVLVVTHLPQVAAFADHHFVVERHENDAAVHRLDGAAQLDELTRMLAGLDDSRPGRRHAAELREAAQMRRAAS